MLLPDRTPRHAAFRRSLPFGTQFCLETRLSSRNPRAVVVRRSSCQAGAPPPNTASVAAERPVRPTYVRPSSNCSTPRPGIHQLNRAVPPPRQSALSGLDATKLVSSRTHLRQRLARGRVEVDITRIVVDPFCLWWKTCPMSRRSCHPATAPDAVHFAAAQNGQSPCSRRRPTRAHRQALFHFRRADCQRLAVRGKARDGLTPIKMLTSRLSVSRVCPTPRRNIRRGVRADRTGAVRGKRQGILIHSRSARA